MNKDYSTFNNHFIFDIPEDNIGFFMYSTTGRPFFFYDVETMKTELKKASEYAVNHGVTFDPDIVYAELIKGK